MPRAPHFMPLLLLLLLLSLPHTQAAFPQDPLPLLTSDLQGECPLPTPLLCELSTQLGNPAREEGRWEVRCRKTRSRGKWTGGGGALNPVTHRCWAHLLHSEATLWSRD